MSKIAIITGISGMVSRHMARFLLNKDYTVVGTFRHSTTTPLERLKEANLQGRVILECCDITDSGSVNSLVEKYKPDEFYSYAAQSDVKVSFDQPELTLRTNIFGTLNILNAIKKTSPKTKLLNCSSSEMFGNHQNEKGLRDENTYMGSRSPYATSKIAAHNLVINYREGMNLFAASSICFNHTSHLRGVNFVEKKITDYVGKLYNLKTKDKLKLGNLDAKRDFTNCEDIVRGQYSILQQEQPEDFILASCRTFSIRQILEMAFEFGAKYTKGRSFNWESCIEQDQRFMRPSELHTLIGDFSKAKEKLGWSPTISFEDTLEEMVKKDLEKYG